MSPETFVSAHSAVSDTRDAVERFYAAVRARDPKGIADLIDDWFAADVVVSEPDSLVYGGRYEGSMRCGDCSPGAPRHDRCSMVRT